LEFWNSSGVKGFELGILQGYNYEKHVSSTGGGTDIKWNSPMVQRIEHHNSTTKNCGHTQKHLTTPTKNKLCCIKINLRTWCFHKQKYYLYFIAMQTYKPTILFSGI
jgi:hypothetical protein